VPDCFCCCTGTAAVSAISITENPQVPVLLHTGRDPAPLTGVRPVLYHPPLA
jgi:hypothetical protein